MSAIGRVLWFLNPGSPVHQDKNWWLTKADKMTTQSTNPVPIDTTPPLGSLLGNACRALGFRRTEFTNSRGCRISIDVSDEISGDGPTQACKDLVIALLAGRASLIEATAPHGGVSRDG